MSAENVDVMALAKRARAKGFATPEQIRARLLAIIARNERYLEYRACHGRGGAYSDLVAEDNEVLGLAVIALNGLEDEVQGEKGQ